METDIYLPAYKITFVSLLLVLYYPYLVFVSLYSIRTQCLLAYIQTYLLALLAWFFGYLEQQDISSYFPLNSFII